MMNTFIRHFFITYIVDKFVNSAKLEMPHETRGLSCFHGIQWP
jgi:hypothetical protein